jgi:hypothetical protein
MTRADETIARRSAIVAPASIYAPILMTCLGARAMFDRDRRQLAEATDVRWYEGDAALA